MNSMIDYLSAGCLVLAVTAAVYGDEPAKASSTNAAPAGATAAGATAPRKSGVWFEGTDLHLGSLPPITFHGFASQGFLYSSGYNYLADNTDGSFEFTELGVSATCSPFKRTRIAVQGFAYDVGRIGNLEPFLDYASIEYVVSDAIGLRGGRVRRPGGIYNHIQDVDLTRTSVLLPQGMYDARWRDFSMSIDGGSVFGNLRLGKAGSLSYELYAGYANITKDGGIAQKIMNGQPPNISFASAESPLFLGGQLWWATPVNGLRVGVSGGQACDLAANLNVATPFGAGASRLQGDFPYYQLSLEYAWRNWTFQAEYYTYMGTITTTTTLPPPLPSSISDSRNTPDSWYVGLSRRINKWFEMGSYYTEYYTDFHERTGSADASQKDLALSLRFDPTDWWILKVEGHYIKGTALLQDNERNPVRNDNGWWMVAVKSTFSF